MTPTGARGRKRLTMKQKAVQIVDFMLDYVERAGAFEGRGRKRRLMLNGGSLHFPTGALRPHVDVMTEDVAKIIAGRGTYDRHRHEKRR